MRRAAPWLLAALLLAAGGASLRQYGVTWDEGLGDYFFGQRYLSFFTSGLDARYLDFNANPYPPGFTPDLSMSPYRIYPWEYFPAANILAAATSRVLSNGLGLVDPFDGFHALNLLLGAVLLVALYRVLDRESMAAAVAATIFLFLSPRIVAELMANIKDFPEMVFFSLTLLAYFVAWERQSTRLLIAAGVLWGLALGTKPNAVFLPFVIAAFLVSVREKRRAFLARTAGALAIGPVVMIAVWPWIWSSPIHHLYSSFFYLATRAQTTAAADTTSPFLMILFTSPPLVLVFLVIGIVTAARQRTPLQRMLLCWTGVVAARLVLPGSTNFDVVRHFLEIFPALAALAGIGFAALVRGRAAVAAALATALAIALAIPLFLIHPFETAYWNFLIGGARGACNRGVPQCGDYWGVSYRKGMEWLNRSAPSDSLLIVPIGEQTVRIAAPVRLRRDIRLVHFGLYQVPTMDLNRLPVIRQLAQSRPLFVMFVLRDEWDSELTILCKSRLTPVAEWRADGQPIMRIYRL